MSRSRKLLLIGATGVYSLLFSNMLPETWVMTVPFADEPVTVMSGVRYVVPVVLVALTLWVAFRAVNLPTFAEFLIATEAEILFCANWRSSS